MQKELKLIIAAALGIFAIPVGCASYKIVDPGHRGVSITLGKVSPQALPEGLNFKKPFIESVIEVPVQQITQDAKTQCFTSDLQVVDVAYSVMYRIPETKVVELYQQFKGDPFDSLVKPRVEEQLKQVTSAYKSEDLVKSREVVKTAVLEKLRKELAGLVDIRDLIVRNLDLSDILEAAIEKKQVYEQEALGKVYQMKTAASEAEITLIKAKAEAESIKIAGEALKENPGVVALKAIDKWDGISPKTLVIGQKSDVLIPTENK